MTAINAEASIAYIAEVTPGVTPATPAFKSLRAQSESLKPVREYYTSPDLNGKRGPRNYAIAKRSGAGGFSAEFANAHLDDMIEGALRATWAANILTDANVDKSFTFETKFEDGATDVYKRLTGARIDTFNMTLRAGEPVVCEVGLVAMGGDYATAIVTGATYTAANTEPIEMGAGINGVSMFGITPGCVQEITFSVNNNLRPVFCLGSADASDVKPGTLEVTGSITTLLSASQISLIRSYLDGTATSLTFDVSEIVSKGTRFFTPSIILEDMDIVAESDNGDTLVKLKWRALQSATLSNSTVRVTRLV